MADEYLRNLPALAAHTEILRFDSSLGWADHPGQIRPPILFVVTGRSELRLLRDSLQILSLIGSGVKLTPDWSI